MRASAGAVLGLILLVALLPAQALAQAGPPLITNDPDTPGDGNWEINLALNGAHGSDLWDLAAPELDVNYGLGERIQLSVNVGWGHQRLDDAAWQSGSGPVEFAVRWRFVDEAEHGFAMALQPNWTTSLSAASRRLGLAPANDEFGLPLQVSTHIRDAVVGMEVGRTFINHEPDAWQLGAFWSRDCTSTVQCLAEIHTEWVDGQSDSVVNIGARKSVGERMNLLVSVGHDVDNTSSAGQTIFYLGIQFLAHSE